jgi:hypothetical protein
MSNETTVTINFVGNERRPAAGRRVIGFVHGLRGDARDTWTNKENGVYWPTLVREDPAFGDVDVFCVDYKSGTKGSEPELGDLVSQLRKNLEADGIFHYDAVSFVGHSLGSILLRWLLCDDVLVPENGKAFWNKTRLVMTFSAPYLGCRGADAAGRVIIADSVQLEAVKKDSPILKQLDQKWQAVRKLGGKQPLICCAWEKPRIKEDWFMEMESSIHGCDQQYNVMIEENHFNVVKPDGRGHASYMALREAYQRAFAAA